MAADRTHSRLASPPLCTHLPSRGFATMWPPTGLYVNAAAEAIRALSLRVPGIPPSDERRPVPDTYCR